MGTDDGSACEQLRKVKIEFHAVENPETREIEQKIQKGHFHHLWNVGHDITDFDDMDRDALRARIKELEAELKAHKEAGAHKDRIAGFNLKMRSVTPSSTTREWAKSGSRALTRAPASPRCAKRGSSGTMTTHFRAFRCSIARTR